MGRRSRLFASAAFPLLSLSLIFQPANAALLRGQAAAPFASGTGGRAAAGPDAAGFEVAQEQAPDAQQEEQDPRKRKKHGGDEQQGQPQGAAPGQRPAAPQGHAEGEQHRKMKEGQPAAQSEPQAEQPQSPAAQPEAPKPHRQQPQQEAAPAPVSQPQAQPEPRKQHKQQEQSQQPVQQPEQPAPQQPAAQQQATPQAQPEAQPEAPRKKKMKDAGQPAAQDQQQPAQQQGGELERKTRQKPQDQSAAPAAEPVQPAEPAQQEAPTAGKPPKAEGAREHPRQQQGDGQPAAAQEKPQAPKAQPGTQAAPPPENAPAPQQPAGETAAPAAGAAKKPAAPADIVVPEGGQAEGGQQAEGSPPAAAREQLSPQELERRKKIAENPAASNETVVLPVQNGAAVLDSAKDAGRRGSGRGQGGQGQGGQRPPAPDNVRAPTSDADAQRMPGGKPAPAVRIEAVTSEQGRRLDRRPDFAAPQGAQLGDRQDSRVIMQIDNNVFVRHDDTQRFTRDGERPTYEQLSRDRYRETIGRPDGDRIVTVRNRYGDIIQRSRIDARGREYVLFYSPELEDQPDQDYFRDPGDDLPPMRLRIPLNQYIIDTSSDQDQDYYDFLREPPVEPVERVYSLNEVRYSARIRDKVRRIDLDTITFATGSADIPMAQAKTLRGIAEAIGEIIKKDPTETFLIEGHTDAVGSAASNLILSDQRAESVANVLTDVYGIPPENLATQGYGEQYLKVNTPGPEQENRRVTIRRVTALVRPIAANQ